MRIFAIAESCPPLRFTHLWSVTATDLSEHRHLLYPLSLCFYLQYLWIESALTGDLATLRDDELGIHHREIAHSREQEILKWLNFRRKDWRYEEIKPAYQSTFEWIFGKPPKASGWDDISSFLSGDEVAPPYFVNGKAGSGKSTLMKFIVEHPKTVDALKTWAGTGDYLVLSFFFWNLGTALQKTHKGPLRTLIHAILSSYPELIPVAFPKIYHHHYSDGLHEEPSYVELKKPSKRSARDPPDS